MKRVEKDLHHHFLAVLLVIFIIADVEIPEVVEEFVDTLLGKVLVIAGSIALIFAHPLLGALGVIAAYKIFQFVDTPVIPAPTNVISPTLTRVPQKIVQAPRPQLTIRNQFPTTVEEQVISKMLPRVGGNLPPSSFKPVMDSLHDAAKLA